MVLHAMYRTTPLPQTPPSPPVSYLWSSSSSLSFHAQSGGSSAHIPTVPNISNREKRARNDVIDHMNRILVYWRIPPVKYAQLVNATRYKDKLYKALPSTNNSFVLVSYLQYLLQLPLWPFSRTYTVETDMWTKLYCTTSAGMEMSLKIPQFLLLMISMKHIGPTPDIISRCIFIGCTCPVHGSTRVLLWKVTFLVQWIFLEVWWMRR